MRRALTTAVLCLGIAAIGGPAAIAGNNGKGKGDGNGGRSADAKACKALMKADRNAFRNLHGKHAMRKCIHGSSPAVEKVSPRELKNAAQTCRAEREADPEAFRETHGTNNNKRNAFGKCVAVMVRDADRKPEEPEDGADTEA